MTKFIEFKTKTGGAFEENKQISKQEIYDFIAWAGETTEDSPDGPNRPISSVTIKKYIDGIRAWHIVKFLCKPPTDPDIVRTLINATKRKEEQKDLVTLKQPIMIRQLFELLRHTHGKSETEELIGVVGLVAFWGITRLGELLRPSASSGALLRRHVEFGSKAGSHYVKLHLRKAKTAKPGEVQTIHLQQQLNVLDPVAALRRLLDKHPGSDPDEILFASFEGGSLKPLSKTRFLNGVGKIWGKSSVKTWSGHSFRVGGASLRFNLGTKLETIAKQGRWKSDTYHRYLKPYAPEDVLDSRNFLAAIEDVNWSEKMTKDLANRNNVSQG